MESSQVADAPSDQRHFEGGDKTDTLTKPQYSGLPGDSEKTFTDKVVNQVKSDGSEAVVSDGSVQKKPPIGLLQSVGCTISETVASAKEVITGNKAAPPQSIGSITGRDATQGDDILELDAHHKDKLQEHLNSPADAKHALVSTGAAVASSAAAAKDAVVRALSSTTAPDER